MKVRGPLQQAIRLVCMLIFLTGCAAYGSRLAIQSAGLSPKSVRAMPAAGEFSAGLAITSTPTPRASPTFTPTRTPTQTAYTHIPPGLAKKTGTPPPHIPPGLAKKTSTPIRTHLPPGWVKKTPTPTNTPSPVPTWTGSVLIEDGKWGIPGCVGQTINIKVEFKATSPFGPVKEMQVGEQDWEPFVPVKYYPHTIAPNWYYWGISVKYRDEHGNISPVYSDDISMEGMGCPTITVTP